MSAHPNDDVVEWDPTVPSPFDQEVHELEAAQRDVQRRQLFEIREKLQRAMIVGDRFNCVERNEQMPAEAHYVAASAAVHRVLADPHAGHDVSYASNVATSLLLSRQFEGISRKDVVIQESDERMALLRAFHATLQLQYQRDLHAVQRKCRAQVEEAEQREAQIRAQLSNRLAELEHGCRRRTEQAAEETFAIIARDSSRAFNLANVGHRSAQRNWLEQEEERGRWSLVVECERGLSRIFNIELSQGQEIRNRELLHRKVPMSPTALIDADGPDSTRLGVDGDSSTRRTTPRSTKRGGGEDDSFKPRASTVDVGDEYPAHEVDLIPNGPHPGGIAESETSSVGYGMQDNPNSFKPYWGWMFKSTGVLMTWQRRFFVFTTRGKLKCSSSDKGPWTVLLTANNIVRVEVDSYHDTSSGIAPPTSQYHQYGFFIDAFDPQSPQRPKRLRFCCFCRKELNAWLTVLRRATDVIFALEESGSIARSPARRRLDLSDEKTRQAIRNLTAHGLSTNTGGATRNENGEVTAPPTYRRRTQLEEDLAALEHRNHQREMKLQHERSRASIAQGHFNHPSDNFGPPPEHVDPTMYSGSPSRHQQQREGSSSPNHGGGYHPVAAAAAAASQQQGQQSFW